MQSEFKPSLEHMRLEGGREGMGTEGEEERKMKQQNETTYSYIQKYKYQNNEQVKEGGYI